MLIILQGRLNSKRLPCKGLVTFFGETIFGRMINIAKKTKGAKKIFFATTHQKNNKIIKDLCVNKKIKYYEYKGDENNVYDRFYKIVKKEKPKYFIRITCDNYLVQPKILNFLYNKVKKSNADYGYIESLSHFSGEVIKASYFLKQKKKLNKKSKEHVTWQIRRNTLNKKIMLPKNFLKIDHEKSPALDNLQDLIFLKELEKNFPQLKKVDCLKTVQKIFKKKT